VGGPKLAQSSPKACQELAKSLPNARGQRLACQRALAANDPPGWLARRPLAEAAG